MVEAQFDMPLSWYSEVFVHFQAALFCPFVPYLFHMIKHDVSCFNLQCFLLPPHPIIHLFCSFLRPVSGSPLNQRTVCSRLRPLLYLDQIDTLHRRGIIAPSDVSSFLNHLFLSSQRSKVYYRQRTSGELRHHLL